VETGEILIAYNVKIVTHDLNIQAWSTFTTRWKLVSPGFNMSTLNGQEIQLVEDMRKWWNMMGGAPGAKGVEVKRDSTGSVANEEGPQRNWKEALIENMVPGKFYDLTGEVASFA